MRRFNAVVRVIAMLLLCAIGTCAALPPGYKGKPFKDKIHKYGPNQSFPPISTGPA